MSKRILFLCRTDERTEYDTAWSMAREMQHAPSGTVYEAANLEDLLFSFDGTTLRISDSQSGKEISGYDGIFMLGWFKTKALEDIALSVARFAAANNIPLLNSEALYTRSRTKLSQYVIAALHNVHITPFVYCANHRALLEYLREEHLAFPLIVKSTMASRGRDNYLVRDLQEIEGILQNQTEVPFVVQTFVPNDGDYRLLVMGDSVKIALHRKSQTASHVNNTSQGGVATLVDVTTLDTGMLKDAVTIAGLLRREVTGVDMILHRDTGEYYMLEANNMPQLSTGSMVTDKMKALDAYLTRMAD